MWGHKTQTYFSVSCKNQAKIFPIYGTPMITPTHGTGKAGSHVSFSILLSDCLLFLHCKPVTQAVVAAEVNIGAYREKVIESWMWMHQLFFSHSPAAIQGAASPALEICLSSMLSLVHIQALSLASKLWN